MEKIILFNENRTEIKDRIKALNYGAYRVYGKVEELISLTKLEEWQIKINKKIVLKNHDNYILMTLYNFNDISKGLNNLILSNG